MLTTIPAPYLVTAATAQPVTLAEAKKQVELATQDTAHDNHLQTLIAAATQQFESDSGIVCVDSRWAIAYECFPCDPWEFPRRPITSVVSIQYVDTAGATQTLSSSVYTLDANTLMPRIFRSYAQDWPAIRSQENAVTLTYQAGYSSPSTVPERIKNAILLLVCDWFENRGSTVTGTITAELPIAYSRLIASLGRPNYP